MALDTSYLRFKSVSHFGDSHITDRLETSLVYFLNWAFLEIGAFFNVTIPTSGAFGGDFSKLRAVKDPAFTNYTVYETARKDIIWESGMTYASGTPIVPSGVWINGVFSSPTGLHPHYINYPLGRVVFETPLASTDTVKMEYSYRWPQVYVAGDAPWAREIQFESFRVDNPTFTQFGSGNWAIGSEKRVQLPAIVIDASESRSFSAYELGSSSNWVHQVCYFDIISETKYERDRLVDIISTQNDRAFYIFNYQNITHPLDYRGAKVTNGPNYPDLVQTIEDGGFRWQPCWFRNTQVIGLSSPHPNLYLSRVRVNFLFPFGAT